MIIGLGTDIVEIGRIAQFIARGPRYVERVFTASEMRLAAARGDRAEFFAGRFAAKEAVAKCLGPPFAWHDVEVLSATDGKPEVRLSGRARLAAGDGHLMVSISHSRGYAVAVALLQTMGP